VEAHIELTGPWMADLGYDRVSGALVRNGDAAVDVHPFAPELRAIFDPEMGLGSGSVLCVDRVPTVCLVDQAQLSADPDMRRKEMRDFCERLWNQNLARVVLVTDPEWLEAWSVDNPDVKPQRYSLAEREAARLAWSVSGLLGGEALRGRDAWFAPERRVDKILLDNILILVGKLAGCSIDPAAARRLVARLIFMTYLEDRGIISETYRTLRKVRPLFELVQEGDRAGLRKLVNNLRSDFNGDFLTIADSETGWENLSDEAFDWIAKFLGRTTLRTGQASFWRYDFSHIPIELIASIYETFLASRDEGTSDVGGDKAKRQQGAYYTPRLLADWVVELAVDGRDILSERFFDGACGSGMLLTAAFRRIVRAHEAHEARAGRSAVADFATRRDLLIEHIHGGDIDEDACQLTAFSLYLALLSDLNPRDIAELREGGYKLPTLTKNIRRGDQGDFFSEASEAVNRGRYSIFLSNPPWRKLKKKEPAANAVEAWRMRQPKPLPHVPKGQIAAAFALGAADTLRSQGRIALILPVTPFVSGDPTQRDFRTHLLGRYRIDKIVNFSDMRRLIFADAVHPFVVLIAEVRAEEARFQSIEAERFEYWTPKTDIALAFGRLAVHGGDRADLPASALIGDEAQLAIHYWGAEPDIALLRRLQRRGSIRDLTKSGWVDAKGFHAKDEDPRRDKSTWYVNVPEQMKKAAFLPARALPKDLPFIPSNHLAAFPFDRIARVPEEERLFNGPRVLWTDGAHPTDGVKAVYAEAAFSFQHSLAVLAAPNTDDGRLTARFLTAYLRSPMGLWLLLLLSSSVASERPKLHLCEALDWPFWSLDRHPKPDEARKIMQAVDETISLVEAEHELLHQRGWDHIQREVNNHVYAYFRLAADEIAMIEELASLAGPALQPTSLRFSSLMKPLRGSPSIEMMSDYCTALAKTLTRWRDATGGEGDIRVVSWSGRSVPIGAAVLTLGNAGGVERIEDDGVIEALAEALERKLKQPAEQLLTVPDIAIVDGNRIFIVKPLIARFWMRRCAIEDATRLALQLQTISRERTPA
jgi:hypothetical protein